MTSPFDIGEIFNAYNNKVYRLALSITRNEKDAEDVMQNTFFKILKNLKYFRRKSQLSTWIYKIAYNEALMNLRKRKSQFKLSGSLKLSSEKGTSGLFVNWAKLPDEYLLDEELKERIQNAIKRMPIRYRMALLLCNVEGIALKESAVILGLKINSLKTRLHRARLLLKSSIAGYLRDREEEKGPAMPRRCGIWTGFVYNYARGNLNPKRSDAFGRHIKSCVSCNSFLNSYRKAIDITGAVQCHDLPDELKERVESFILKAALEKKKSPYN
ncbi:MAG: sigma-70 family RNA polymerase sigma factor [Candidatus Omnitrophica bacterium]|nr:sigma-70 family RNA polymerase sigma factor [Candidatus Omnitrophota bacterium]MDD5552261.1 sigma-70 family RNA polymerase sigma factor [Candidatus Omnitrophota bacterium]